MYSIPLPNILNGAKLNIIKYHDATKSNLKLLLASVRTSLLGDPYFGTNLKKYLYDNNNAVLKDIVIDEIYTAIGTFMPQIYLTRNSIDIVQDKGDLTAKFTCTNLLDNTTNLYEIPLTKE